MSNTLTRSSDSQPASPVTPRSEIRKGHSVAPLSSAVKAVASPCPPLSEASQAILSSGSIPSPLV